MLILDDQQRIVEANPAACRLIGRSGPEVIGQAVWMFYASDDRRPHEWEQLLVNGRARSVIEVVNAQAERRTVEYRGTANVSPGLHFFILRDVTDEREAERLRRAAEEAMRTSETRLAQSQAIAHLGSWEAAAIDVGKLDAEIWWSAETYRIFGYAPNDQRRPVELFLAAMSRPDIERLVERLEDSVRRRAPFVFEHAIRRPDGTERIVFEQASLVIDSAGGERLVGTVQDVTEARTLERQLRQAMKMEAIGRLAGGIAHDFNNLLGAILSLGELIIADMAPTDARRADMDQILAAARRGADLTHQLLAFSRQQVLELRVFDLNARVSGIERLLRRLIGEHIDLQTRLTTEPVVIRADPGQLEQVVLNLAVNARDAMPRGGELTIATSVQSATEIRDAELPLAPGKYAVLSVSDTGVGMDAATRARIFEPFFTTKPEGHGTGLGLATVYGIVKQSGGYISVHTEPGQGTTFTIYLPLLEQPTPVEPPAPVSAEQPVTGSEVVLLVDDESMVRLPLARGLKRYGYQVVTAASGEEALEAAGRHPRIDILVTDVVMPGMSGRVLSERFSARMPGISTIFTSGYTDDAIVHHDVLEGSLPFLQKPFTAEALARKIREVLGPPD